MALPLHMDAERIGGEFDVDAFAAGQAGAGLIGCVQLANYETLLASVESNTRYWHQNLTYPCFVILFRYQRSCDTLAPISHTSILRTRFLGHSRCRSRPVNLFLAE
jgi:hypothetical protein